jgi:cobalt-zinc-cadmium efflux system outer membrane protein
MRKVVLSAALAAVWMPAGIGAQSLMLTESDALSRLSTDSPRVRAARAGVDVAKAHVLSANRWPNPRLNWDRQSVAGGAEHYFTVSQALAITGRRGLDAEAASALVSARSSRADDEIRRLRADLRLAFAELVSAQTEERELVRARDRLRELGAVLAARESEGDAAGFDRLRATSEVLDIESDLAGAATERARAQAMLASYFGDGADAARVIAVGSPVAAAAVPTLDALLVRADSVRGDLVAFRHEIEAARLAAEAADRSLVPEPEIFLGTKSSTAASVGAGSALTIGDGAVGPVIGVHATIPLFDRAGPERALAAARAAQSESAAASFRAVLRGQVAASRESVLQRRAAADRYRLEAVSSAAEIERIAQFSYDAGERGILELLDAYRVGASARVRQARLDFMVRQAEVELEFVSGWELP